MMLHERSDLSLVGFEGPVRVFSEGQCGLIMRHWRHVHEREIPVWPKALAVYDRFFYDLATRPVLLDQVRDYLGENVILWGVSVIVRHSGQKHHWHSDAESSQGEGFLSVWIGLAGISQESALNVIRGSHLLGKTVQQLMTESGMSRENLDDEAVLKLAATLNAEAKITRPQMQVGDAIFFDGRLWHGTDNMSGRMRTALLIQYARADRVVRQPKQYEAWPLVFEDTPLPVIAVSGTVAHAHQTVVTPPSKGHFSSTTLEGVIRNWSLPLEGDPDSGWKPHSIARGSTPNVSSMSVHASVLAPGKSPHPPHAHVEEEILLILDGVADILLGEGPDPEVATVHPLKCGAFAYYPAYQYHTIRNAGTEPVTYLMFKWSGPPIETEGQAKTAFVPFPEKLSADAPFTKGFQAQRFFQEPTAYLHRLHAHLTFLSPGSGYDKHADTHDVAIVVLDGEVISQGCKAGPGSVMYFPAGQLHDMANEATAAARYLVFEFKGPEQNDTNSREFWDSAADHKDVSSGTHGGEGAGLGLRNVVPLGREMAAEHLIEKSSVGGLASQPVIAPRRQRPLLIRIVNSAISWLLSPLTRKIERVVDRRLRILLAEERKRKD